MKKFITEAKNCYRCGDELMPEQVWTEEMPHTGKWIRMGNRVIGLCSSCYQTKDFGDLSEEEIAAFEFCFNQHDDDDSLPQIIKKKQTLERLAERHPWPDITREIEKLAHLLKS